MGRYKFLLAGFALLIILLGVYYGGSILHANHIAFHPQGDGYKNYYTLAYYLKYDKGSHFSGMNYPYGEHVIYTDNQPLLAWLLKPLTTAFPVLLNYIQAIIVYLLMLGHLLCYLILYKILRRFSLPGFFAAIFAVFIVMLSPQMARLNGHFSLGYTFFIPLIIWWLIRLTETGYSIKYLLLLTLTLTASMFIHPYYYSMAALFILSLCTVLTVQKKVSVLNISGMLLSIVLPFIILKLYLLITDPITDRPSFPWGFVMSRSTIADILLHPASFINQALSVVIPKGRIVFHSEGHAYIGVSGIIAMLILLAYSIVPKLRRGLHALNFPPLLYTLLIASIPVLLFAMAFPFSINTWFEGLLEYMPSTIKQFRASGRFSWVFYYIVGICTAVVTFRVYTMLNKKAQAYSFLTTILLLWLLDISTTNNYNKQQIKQLMDVNNTTESIFSVEERLKEHGYSLSGFQALMPTPYYHAGSERIYAESPAIYNAMRLSLATGLPLNCGQLSRISETQSFKLLRLVSSPYIKKDVLNNMNGKPLLLLDVEGKHTEADAALVNKAKFIFKNEIGSFYQLPLSAFNDVLSQTKHEVAARKDGLLNHNTYYSFDSTNNAIVVNFDSQAYNVTMMGKGAVYSANGLLQLYKGGIAHAATGSMYEVSCWIYADNRRAAFPIIGIKQYDAYGNELSTYEYDPKFETNTYGKWLRASFIFTLVHSNNVIAVYAKGQHALVDELLIRPLNTTVLTHTGKDSFMYNNFPIY